MPATGATRALLSALALGAVAACGFAPLDLWPLTLAAFGAWIWLVHDAPSLRAALARGWMFGVGHFTINDNWFQHAFDFQDKMPPVLGYAAPLALALYLAVYPMAAAGLTWRLAARPGGDAPRPAFVLLFASAWMATEYLRATLFTGYAWDPLGVVWLPLIGVARAAAWIGTYAMSGLAILTAGTLPMLVRGRWRPALAATAGLALVAALTSLGPTPAAPRPDVLLRVVQPNIGQEQRDADDGTRVFRVLASLSGRPGPTPRLLLWPEGVLRDLVEDGYPSVYYQGLDPLLARLRLAQLLGPRDVLLAGGSALQFDADGNLASATNSVFAVDAAARLGPRYDKAHLVPYGEYLPMPWLLRPLGLARLVPGDMDFMPGPGPRTLAIPGFGAIGFQLCYEIIFPGHVVDPAHRPRFLFNPSNDAWFGRWGPPQHLAQARMRAIEEGLPIVRSTPTGISAVIDARGRLLATVPWRTAGAIELPLPAALPLTMFARLGNAIPLAIGLALAIAGFASRRRAR